MKKAKQQQKGHDTKERFYKYLVVRWHYIESNTLSYIFYNNNEEYEEWCNYLLSKGLWPTYRQIIFKDVTYILNEMVKLRGTKKCEDLFSIYKKHYKDQLHIEKVREYLGIEV